MFLKVPLPAQTRSARSWGRMPAAWREQVSAPPGCRMPGLSLAASQTEACCCVGAQLSVGQARATSGR